MPFNLGDFFKKKGARVEKSDKWSDESNMAMNMGYAFEQKLVNQLEDAHPELGSIINEDGFRDPEVWAKVEALARAGDAAAKQLVALEGDDEGDMTSGVQYCAESGCTNTVEPPDLYCREHSDG